MSLIKKYKNYRKIGMALNHKIMESCFDNDVIGKSARLLGIAQGNALVLDHEEEESAFMDFTLHDYQVDDKNIIEFYQEKFGWKNKEEKDILNAWLSSYTSLFKVISVLQSENMLVLYDILNDKDNIKLTDIAFSKTAILDLLLFFRLVPHEDFNMTSGISFAFSSDIEKYLLKRHKILSKRVKSDSESIKRFVSFFKLNRTDGMKIGYI